ncbi:MAG: hypothetical protein FJY99_11360 [Candidatus Sericytochromatia bacterium]|nr:hypothetical protein [Candidatus Tanganyikabacteria bacterium]
MSSREVQAIAYTPPPQKPGSATSVASAQEQADGFLKMLVAQLTNQDPEAPLNATDMIAQFAQVNAAISMSQINEVTLANQRVNAATALIDRMVTLKVGRDNYIKGRVESLDFSKPDQMPRVRVNGEDYRLDQVEAVEA